jgi:hypothetical protein
MDGRLAGAASHVLDATGSQMTAMSDDKQSERRARSIRIALAHAAVILLIYFGFILKNIFFGGD